MTAHADDLRTLSKLNMAAVRRYRRKARELARKPSAVAARYSNDKWAETAIEYARWIARRDGIELPDGKRNWVERVRPKAIWGHVYTGRTRKRGPRWEGDPPFEMQVAERRIRAVEWGYERDVYNERKNGKQGAWSHKQWVCELNIELPNWDWVPEVVAEEIEGLS